MFAVSNATLEVGVRNEAAVRDLLAAHRITVIAAETGGDRGRTIRVHVGSSQVTVREAGGIEIVLVAGNPRVAVTVMSSGGPVLSEDAIAALVDAARDGRLPEEKPAPQRRRRMRAVDFTRPTKFTSEQERRIGRTLEAFSRTASTRLSAELRVPLELEVLTSTQLTWANAHAQVPANSTAAIFEVEPIGTRMLLSTESTLLLAAIELLLGGSIDGGVKERRMTDIDQALGRHFFERLLAQLTLIWTDVAGLSLKLETVDQHMETAQMVSVSEPTLSLMMEARHRRPLRDPGAADPVDGDRAGGRPVRRPRGRQGAALATTRRRRCGAPSATSR